MSAAAVEHTSMTPLECEFEELQERFPGAEIRPIDTQWLISVSRVPLPVGWSAGTTTVHFLVPAGYPHANPDCFYTDVTLRLASGALPQNAQILEVAGLGETLWFSYHLQRPWKPGRDRLTTWMATIIGRLRDIR